ncbi:hypothetical protein JW887_03975 [Candidatus Dojkabacteria bacterium]|nr:hypothetical protein [Candidatus Dojkabacteria bacterium]
MNILFTPITSSSIAHIIRSFALAERFQSDGHNVYFTSCTLKKGFIEKEGYSVVKVYDPFNLNDEQDQSVSYLSSHKKELVTWFKAEIEAAQDVNADVVIGSPNFLGPHVTHATGVPTIALMNGQYVPTSRGLMGISLSNNSLPHKFLRNILRPIFNRQFIKKYLCEVLDAYRIIGIKTTFKSREDLYSDMPILIPGDMEFEPQDNITKYTRFIGPIFWNGFEKIDGDLTEESILKFKANKQLLFVTFGGSVFDKVIYGRVLDGLKKIDAKKIVALGPNFDRSEFPSDNENMIIRNFVPGFRLSRLSDIVVNTGSQGAIMQALVNGKPVVSFPVGIDQAYFANRLEEMHLGRNANKSNIYSFTKRETYQFVDDRVPENMVSYIRELLEDPSYSNNAKAYSIRINKRYPDPINSAVEFIYNYLAKK